MRRAPRRERRIGRRGAATSPRAAWGRMAEHSQHHRPIDFADLCRALLDRAETLVPQWLPGGRRQGAEWICGDLTGGPAAAAA